MFVLYDWRNQRQKILSPSFSSTTPVTSHAEGEEFLWKIHKWMHITVCSSMKIWS